MGPMKISANGEKEEVEQQKMNNNMSKEHIYYVNDTLCIAMDVKCSLSQLYLEVEVVGGVVSICTKDRMEEDQAEIVIM